MSEGHARLTSARELVQKISHLLTETEAVGCYIRGSANNITSAIGKQSATHRIARSVEEIAQIAE